MATRTYKCARVRGVSVCSPRVLKKISEEERLFSGKPGAAQVLENIVGLGARYIAPPGVTALDMGVSAAESLMKKLAIQPAGIDAVLFVTQTPDNMGPSNAALLHAKLGLAPDCAALDVNLGCSGYVYGLWLAFAILSSGGAGGVLLVTGDTLSRHVPLSDPENHVQFGDAGSATYIAAEPGSPAARFSLNTDGRRAGLSIMPLGSSSATMENSSSKLVIDGKGLFDASISCEAEAIAGTLADSGTAIDGVDYYFFHQANKFGIRTICRKLGIPMEKAPCVVLKEFGNQGSSSLPMVICEAFKSNDRARATTVLSGFGTGLSWGVALLELPDVFVEHHFLLSR